MKMRVILIDDTQPLEFLEVILEIVSNSYLRIMTWNLKVDPILNSKDSSSFVEFQ